MKRAAIIVVLAVVVLGLRFWNRGQDDHQVLADMKDVIKQVAVSPEETTYLETILAREHPKAFDAAYSMGSRRRASEFNEEQYLRTIFKAWIECAQNDHKAELVERLSALQQVVLAEQPT